ncbi:MAG: 4-(cytidine 5'-diphospho)-2-C-methyl-D-erythritol kinase [Melioribacteraceae bacterium]|nr:4-(cytidine 5'-diphospho)-2-C-methyl-D-erythritol kinase [Melioribacteraceae bacterium]
MERLTLNASAKINLGLNIVSKREDGYHNLETFFYPIYDLNDKIIFELNNNFIFDSNNYDLVKDPNNLILRAHSIIENYCKKKLPIKITLIKNIPIGAGLGGGSSDAAATLLGLNEIFELGIPIKKLSQFALELGSDVPFFISAKPAVGYSRGEVLHISEMYIDKPILIVNPGIHISTKQAFQNIKPNESRFNYSYFLNNDKIDFSYLSKYLTNDFEKYCFSAYPEVREIKELMRSNNALLTLMSGTGSTVYGIFDNYGQAEKVLEKLSTNYFTFLSQ